MSRGWRYAGVFVIASVTACASHERPPVTSYATAASSAAPSTATIPSRTKETGCLARGPLPDAACTPGAVMTTDLAVVCGQSTQPRRNVPPSLHREAFTDCGYSYPQARGAFEVDHLIPLELGGDKRQRTCVG